MFEISFLLETGLNIKPSSYRTEKKYIVKINKTYKWIPRNMIYKTFLRIYISTEFFDFKIFHLFDA